jgi:hypothetical protein
MVPEGGGVGRVDDDLGGVGLSGREDLVDGGNVDESV